MPRRGRGRSLVDWPEGGAGSTGGGYDASQIRRRRSQAEAVELLRFFPRRRPCRVRRNTRARGTVRSDLRTIQLGTPKL